MTNQLGPKDFKPHSTLTVLIQYAPTLEAFHDEAPLVRESIVLNGRYHDRQHPVASTLEIDFPDRLWFFPINKEPGPFGSGDGEKQLRALSNEGLEVLRNTLGNLHKQATAILNERGAKRHGLAPAEPSGDSGGSGRLGSGSGLLGPPGGSI